MTNNLKEQLDLTDSPETMCGALRQLALDIRSPDDIPQLCLRDAANMIETLAAAYREAMTLRPMESAPRDGTQIICYTDYGEATTMKWCENQKDFMRVITCRRCYGMGLGSLIGWLPLPTPIAN